MTNFVQAVVVRVQRACQVGVQRPKSAETCARSRGSRSKRCGVIAEIIAAFCTFDWLVRRAHITSSDLDPGEYRAEFSTCSHTSLQQAFQYGMCMQASSTGCLAGT